MNPAELEQRLRKSLAAVAGETPPPPPLEPPAEPEPAPPADVDKPPKPQVGLAEFLGL